jgi:hypothetical protein
MRVAALRTRKVGFGTTNPTRRDGGIEDDLGGNFSGTRAGLPEIGQAMPEHISMRFAQPLLLLPARGEKVGMRGLSTGSDKRRSPHPELLHSPSKTGVNALMASGEREQRDRVQPLLFLLLRQTGAAQCVGERSAFLSAFLATRGR